MTLSDFLEKLGSIDDVLTNQEKEYEVVGTADMPELYKVTGVRIHHDDEKVVIELQ